MKIVQLMQGTPEWHAHRAQHLNASDAPAMMGCSPYKNRAQLVREMATGVGEEVDAERQRIFDAGHRYEALARPLAEQIVGEDLFPVTGTEGKYSASFDGLTLLEDVAFEHKSLNDALRVAMVDGCTGADLPLVYRVQMEHQALVSGAGRVLFMASKWAADDTLIEERHCWYTPDAELRARLIAGWEQFEADVAAYEHVEKIQPAPAGRAPDSLPALSVVARGMVEFSNLAEFREKALAVIAAVKTDLRTDDDFATAELTVKAFKAGEEKLEATKDQILGQMSDVDAVMRTIDEISAEMKRARLQLDKLVTAEKEKRRGEIVEAGKQAVIGHYQQINASLGAHALQVPLREITADLGTAIKGKRSLSSMQDAVDSLAAQHKVVASQAAERVRACVRVLDMEVGTYGTLFPDAVQLCAQKQPEDLRNLITARIAEHQQREREREEAQRERIRKEEADRLEREQRQRDEERAAADVPASSTSVPAPPAAPAQASPETAAHAAPAAAAPARRVKLGDINAAIAPLSINAEGLAQLGFLPVGSERSAKLYDAASVPAMCQAMEKVLRAVAAGDNYPMAA
ncbi:hypothetical protein ARC20_03370 [Stenotrophomonas panacihumi]|uniref:YqaJ viral recombinase domain-containing protein n=1 Tax=Stenotrophomonas panacihumi TaxID=676599 RepID=A0A0R0AQG5_9GAMM|nr:YqaJ viral recombinase family protein [Stenotrophomonas panacihumi]KRG47381.1 hypothetical protein ARC20_03370 [Stenotrophomonas panacihumi]PTN55859.1 hypothetical protein C9J98_04610 [Stenotrophomonas panacihumi]